MSRGNRRQRLNIQYSVRTTARRLPLKTFPIPPPPSSDFSSPASLQSVLRPPPQPMHVLYYSPSTCLMVKIYFQNFILVIKSWFSATYISEHFMFCIITHMGDSILKKIVSTFSKWLPGRLCVQYYNMASFPVRLQIQYG